jgi:hypothetical protein
MDALSGSQAPEGLAALQAMRALGKVWARHFERAEAERNASASAGSRGYGFAKSAGVAVTRKNIIYSGNLNRVQFESRSLGGAWKGGDASHLMNSSSEAGSFRDPC